MRAKTEPQIANEAVEASDRNLEHENDIETLQAMLTRGQIEQARCVVKGLETRWPESELVRQFARVLAPPVARVVEGRKGITREQSQQESAWLRDNASRYSGCWVILHEGQFLTAHPRLREAIEEANRQVGSEVGSLHYIPARDLTS